METRKPEIEITRIFEALENKDLELIKTLLSSYGVELFKKRDKYNLTPLMVVAKNKKLKILKLLLSYLASPEPENLPTKVLEIVNLTGGKYNKTALHYACHANDHEAIELLISYGASLGIKDSQGLTPIQIILNGNDAKSEFILKLAAEGLFIGIDLPDFSTGRRVLSILEHTTNIRLFLLGTSIAGKLIKSSPRSKQITTPQEAMNYFAELKNDEISKRKILKRCYLVLKENNLTWKKRKRIEKFYYACVGVYDSLTSLIGRDFELHKRKPYRFQSAALPEEIRQRFFDYMEEERKINHEIQEEIQEEIIEDKMICNPLEKERLLQEIDLLFKQVNNLLKAIPDRSTCAQRNGINTQLIYMMLSILLGVVLLLAASFSGIYEAISLAPDILTSNHHNDTASIPIRRVANNTEMIKEKTNISWQAPLLLLVSAMGIPLAAVGVVFAIFIACYCLMPKNLKHLNSSDSKELQHFLQELTQFLRCYTASPESPAFPLLKEIESSIAAIEKETLIEMVKQNLKEQIKVPLRKLYGEVKNSATLTLFPRFELIQDNNDDDYDLEAGSIRLKNMETKPFLSK